MSRLAVMPASCRHPRQIIRVEPDLVDPPERQWIPARGRDDETLCGLVVAPC